MKKLSKMFDWDVKDILEADQGEVFEKASASFSQVIKFTSHFDSFSEKVKYHRLACVEEALAEKLDIPQEEAKEMLLKKFFQDTPDYYDIRLEGYERPDLKPEPLPEPEEVETTDKCAGYVTPEGLFFGCYLEGHIDLCFDLMRLGMIPSDTPSHEIYAYPDDMGWLKVSNLKQLVFKFDYHNDKDLLPTQQQEEIVQKALLRFKKKGFTLNDNKDTKTLLK